MTALPFLLGTLCVLAIAYRYYSAFLAYRVVGLDPQRRTPAHALYDGTNYHPTNRWVLFGHHFAAITGAGPLIGPVLAAQFGFLPGFLWLLIGVVLAGAVQDFIILFASTRRNGKSLAEIARQEIGPVAGVTTAVAVLFVVIVALAGLGLAVVNALRESPWGVFTIGCSIPIALFVGLYLYRFRKGRIVEASVIGVCGLGLAVIGGRFVSQTPWASFLTLSPHGVTYAIAAYGFIASVLPVWMLLCPRDYLSSYMKVGTIAFLILGLLWVNPSLHQPLVSVYAHGGGPIIPGKVFPFVFVTIACGAISGFHALVGSGTSPKMIEHEQDIRPIGYGAMLMEGLVGITALVACSALHPSDYFAINVSPEKFAALGLTPVNLEHLSRQVGERVAGRTGGAVSLAIGMAQVFSALPGMSRLMSYWYHFAIMFEALFILTTIDTGTRVGRFIAQEFLGRFYPPLARPGWMPGTILSSALIVSAWAYFILTGSISTIWPMFGIANQLLAVIALCVGTTVLINMGKARYAWVTLAPMVFVAVTTLTAGWQSIWDNFLPLAAQPGKSFVGTLNTALTVLMMGCTLVMIGSSALRWKTALSSPMSRRRVEPSERSGSASCVTE
ncbi:MAG: carbon starvation protein A [Candidatus Omnitrophica bacterium]|nr:carbon starvation protein A [Candidatus Omnitrophota bacterium]